MSHPSNMIKTMQEHQEDVRRIVSGKIEALMRTINHLDEDQAFLPRERYLKIVDRLGFWYDGLQ
jgi:hypothetical protein